MPLSIDEQHIDLLDVTTHDEAGRGIRSWLFDIPVYGRVVSGKIRVPASWSRDRIEQALRDNFGLPTDS